MSEEGRTYGNDLRVLLLLRESRDAAAIPEVLDAIGVPSNFCSDAGEISAAIDQGAGAILAEEEALTPQAREALTGILLRQPDWSELPLIVLLRKGPESQVARDALLMPGDVNLLERPIRVHTLVAVVRSALRSRKRQYLIRDQLRALDESASQLRKAKDELELRVEERTSELRQALEKLRLETGERLKGVEELRFKDELLVQQSRMAAMGEMIGFIAHQWRQPLNSLGLITQELAFRYKKGLLDEQSVDVSTTETMRIVNQMSQTINDFKNFFKPESKKVPFRVAETISSTLRLLEASFRAINLKIEVAVRDDVAVEGYPNQFSQVLLNILMNARDVCVERNVAEPRIVVSLWSEEGVAVVTISDNAGGIPEELMERIFEPYFTTKGPELGTGIGLYMAKSIVESNLGGRLLAKNGSEGAEFRIALPVAETRAET